jgi:hypothetical protein
MYHGNLMASMAALALCKTESQKKVPVLWNIRQTVYDLGRERWLTAKPIRLGCAYLRASGSHYYNSQPALVSMRN